jgi:glycosyltransferase involved in cell wall biosynthesis
LIKKFNPQSEVLLHMHCDWLAQLNAEILLPRLRNLGSIIGCSNYISQNVKHRFPEVANRCSTIYYGIDVSAFKRTDGTRNSDQPPRILFVGRVSPEKGIHVLLDAFRLVSNRCPSAELHIIGPDLVPASRMIIAISDDSHTTALESIDPRGYRERIYAALPEDIRRRVYFRGTVSNSDLPSAYNAADVFVFPSEWEEPFGIPVVEAMASGLPVVGTRSGGIVESIEHGSTGFLVDRGDSKALAEALTRLILDPDLRESMGRNGRERAASRFSWDCTATALLSLYESLNHRSLN